MIGGATTWIGPLLGATVLGTAQEVARVVISSEMNLLIVGVLLVFFVVAAPDGFVGLIRKYCSTATVSRRTSGGSPRSIRLTSRSTRVSASA